MIPLLILAPHAWAIPGPAGSTDLGPTQVWSTTAVEARPDLSGQTLDRYAERLGVHVPLGDGWRVGLLGGFRSLSEPDTPLKLDVWRGVVEHRTANHHIVVGRMVRKDPRGLQRLDGISLDLRDDTVARWGFWGGRRWHPEVPDSLDYLVAGAELRIGHDGHSQLSVGVEGRDELGEFVQRSWVAGELRDVVGNRVTVLAETSNKEGRWRGAVDGSLVAGRYLDLGADLRWEGLPPATALDEPRSPILWLAPEGYGIAAASARWGRGDWSWTASGGPVARRGETWVAGGRGRAAATWQATPWAQVQAFATAAGIDRGSIAGGGAGVALNGDGHMLDATAALWSLRPIDGDRAAIAEGRLTGLGKVLDRVRGSIRSQVFLGARGSAGRDRQLAPFFYGGGQVTVRFLGGAS